MACQQPSSCPKGTSIAPCTQTSNYKCAACAPVQNAEYIRQGSCDFRCVSGYFKNGTGYGCVPCSQGVTCQDGQSLLNCSADHDSVCTRCNASQYEFNAGTDSAVCVPCNTAPCSTNGTYRGLCTATTDSLCLPCTKGPLNSYYISPGSLGMDNCSWLCNAGFERKFDGAQTTYICSPCPAGSYSAFGDGQCRSCPAGTYSGLTGATDSGTCSKCPKGTYSADERAISSRVCKDCAIGTYQGSPGSSSCELCPKDTYGTIQAAISQSQCMACRTLDTSTRQKDGQRSFTDCICNLNYYRIDNTTDQCQKCPPGLVCNGYDYVIPAVSGSLWNATRIGGLDYYRLYFCPEGYHYPELLLFSVTDPQANSILGAQQCTPCDAGVECVHPPCVSCSNCLPGKFKSCSGPTDCSECKVDTFQPMNGSLACNQCPKGTTTNGQTGSSSQSVCVCDLSNYDLGQGCQLCPAGMRCFGNATAIPLPLFAGEPEWMIAEDTDGKKEVQPYILSKRLLHQRKYRCARSDAMFSLSCRI